MPQTIYNFGFFGGNQASTRGFEVTGAINGSIGATAAQALRDRNGTVHNLAPIAAPYDAELNTLILSNSTTNNYTVSVLVNGTSVFTSTRTNGTNVEIFDATGISVSRGDQITLRYDGGVGATNRPAAQAYFNEV